MYSDEGYKIYSDTLRIKLPLSLSEGEIDTAEWNAFEKSQSELLSKAQITISTYTMRKHRVYIDGGASSFAGVQYISKFSAGNESDRISANEAWDMIVKTVEEQYEDVWMKNIK